MKKLIYLVPVLMMLMFPANAVADDYLRGDCDEDGRVTIGDVASLIDYLLTGDWGDEIPTEADSLVFKINNVEFVMIRVEGGTFTMGATGEQADDYQSNELPAHQVTLSSYYICSTEVTQELWLEVMGSNPSEFVGVNLPVEKVTWNDCQVFINKLNALTGKEFRLPTEAEWEFAARGGNKSEGYKYSGSNTIGDVAWYSNNASGKTHTVATLAPNELGIYDMSGNVYELCQDWYGNYVNQAQIDPIGPTSGSYRVSRGGCWNNHWGDNSRDCRVSSRGATDPGYNGNGCVGLRLAL